MNHSYTVIDFLTPHIHSNTALCFPHLMLGTSESDYKVALMMIQNKNSCTLKELKSSMRSCEVEELETHEMVDDGFSISGNDIGDDDFSFSDAITPCALNYEEDGRSHLTRLDKQTKSFLSPQTQRLHRDLDKNCAERICVPTMAMIFIWLVER